MDTTVTRYKDGYHLLFSTRKRKTGHPQTMKGMNRKKCIGIVFGLFFCCNSAHADVIQDKVEKPVDRAIATRQMSQKENETWRLQQDKMSAKMAQLQASIKQLQAQKENLAEEIKAGKQRIATKEKALQGIKQIEEQMEPFLTTLMTRLKELPEQGLPFLPDERHQRISGLEKTLQDPEIPLSEKFRKAMEALQIEMDYGRTIESYQQQIELSTDKPANHEKLLVNIFRLGRLGLYFQSLDQSICGFYDPMTEKWRQLPEKYTFSMQKIMEIAAKRRPAEIVSVPLGKVEKP